MKHCKVDQKCGACRYLAVPYSQQLIQKRNRVRELFPGVNVEPVLGMKDPYHYRCKIYCAFGYDRNGHVKAGLYQEHSHKIVYTDVCLIQNSRANAIIHDLCRIADQLQIEPYDEDAGTGVLRYGYLRVSHQSGDVLLTIVIGSHFLPKEKAFLSLLRKAHPEIKTVILNYNHGTDSMVLGPNEKVIYGTGSITDTIDGLTFSISSKSFFQVNHVMTAVLYQTALDLADLKKNETVLDACCGIGTISLLAARQASFVLGVEINPQAIRDAKKNAKINHISNVEFIAMDAEEFIRHLGERPDVVFLDPVRAGLSENFLHTLGSLQPDRIIYVSCNPETQARDTKILRRYGYRIRTMIPVDQFPFTPNIENIALLQKRTSRKY